MESRYEDIWRCKFPDEDGEYKETVRYYPLYRSVEIQDRYSLIDIDETDFEVICTKYLEHRGLVVLTKEEDEERQATGWKE